MYIGEYFHSLDEKGRVNFPAKLREELGDQFVITKGLDGCLAAEGPRTAGKPGRAQRSGSATSAPQRKTETIHGTQRDENRTTPLNP